MTKVKIKKVVPEAKLPTRGTPESAGLDLYSSEPATLHHNQRLLVSTGLSVALEPGYEGQIRPRSGLATKGVTVLNSPGTLDSDYRGVLKVLLFNVSGDTVTVKAGDRIAQLVISKLPEVEIEEVQELDSTERGAGGFGSTGA